MDSHVRTGEHFCNVKSSKHLTESDTNPNDHISKSPVQDFYFDSTILITGGTGFVGKVLVEKLLRSFQVKRIYLLIRVKNNLSVQQRLEDFFKESIFNLLRSENVEIFSKVHPIYTDFEAINLNISNTDRSLLCNEVQIVFNVVASVKFNEKLRDAIEINVLGTKKILDLVMAMKNLKAFLHISTLYSNCNRKLINERVYESEISYEKIIQLTRILDDKSLEKLHHCLVGEMPNTYTMTKRCSENLVNHRAFCLPAGIFRPPIVLSTYKYPFPGWTDNLYGPSGICTWSAKGFLHVIHGNGNKKANLVPVDYCVNAIIASAWDVWRRYINRSDEITELPVYNYIFDTNNLTWGKYMHLSRKGFHEPFDKALWYFSYVIVPSKQLHRITIFLLHNIPGYILDLIALATGHKRIYSKGYSKMSKVIEMMAYFGTREWKFNNQNVLDLNALLDDKDKEILEFDLKTIDWTEYFRTYLSGIRRYFFKETDEKLDIQKTICKRFYLLHLTTKTSFGIFLVYYFYKIILRCVRKIRKQ